VAEAWHNVPCVFIVAPHCPVCFAGRPIIVRSEANGDGSKTRKAVCRRCSEKFKIVVELPEFGKVDSAFSMIPKTEGFTNESHGQNSSYSADKQSA
jgi:hypothetical protein